MKIGDLVKVKPRYSEWDYGTGIFLGLDPGYSCRVLFDNRVLVFYKHELEVVNESR